LVTIATTLVSLICYMSYSGHYLQYRFKMQMQDILPSILISTVMYVAVRLTGMIRIPVLLVLLLQILAGAAVYVALSVIFKLEPFRYLLGMLKRKR